MIRAVGAAAAEFQAMSTSESIAFGLALFATVWPCMLAASGASSALAGEDHMVESGDPGIRLFIRNKHPVGMTQFQNQRTLLYVHGATQAASSTFDLKVHGESWMDHIARQGYDVYLVDLRGYGRSTRPPEFAHFRFKLGRRSNFRNVSAKF